MIIKCTKTNDGMIEDNVDGELMVLDSITEKVHLLSQITTEIWNFIDVNTSVIEIENHICNLCEISDEAEKMNVKNDIQEILYNLKEENLIDILEG